MEVVYIKIMVAIIFGIFRFICGVLPIKLDKYLQKWEESKEDSKYFVNERRHKQITCAVALVQSFGGGVMFATCFLHMMKELFLSMEEMRSDKNYASEYPFSQLVISSCFFFVYFLEEFTNWLVNRAKRKQCSCKALDKVTDAMIKQTSPKTLKSVIINDNSCVISMNSITTIDEWILNSRNNKLTVDFQNENNFNKSTKLKTSEVLASPSKSDNSFRRTASGKSRHSIKEELDNDDRAALQSLELTPDDTEKLKNQEQLMRCVLTICALSLHSILEGVSIGIQKFKYEILYLFIGVSAHSASILFCMGVELILAQTRVRYIVIQMLALAIASPVGIVLGLLVTAETSMHTTTMHTTKIILEGLSAGTILYVTFFEVLNREKQRRVYRLRRCLCILGGFSLMAILQYSESKCQKHEKLFFKYVKQSSSSHNNNSVSLHDLYLNGY